MLEKLLLFFVIKIKTTIKNKGLPKSSGNPLTLPFVFFMPQKLLVYYLYLFDVIKRSKQSFNIFIHSFISRLQRKGTSHPVCACEAKP